MDNYKRGIMKDLLEIKEAAHVLGISKQTIRNWENKGFISSTRHPVSRYRLYKKEDLQQLLDKINQ